MAFYRKHRTRLTVSPSPWSVNTVLLVTVFVVTSGLVYHWGHVAGSRAETGPAFKATASIRHAELLPEVAEAPHSSPSDDLLARAEQQIRSPESLARAVRPALPVAADDAVRDGTSSAAAMDQLQAGLEVAREEGGAGEMRIRLSYTDHDRERASALLLAVAGEYAETFRREWRRRTEKAHTGAAMAAEEARREWQHAETQRQEFIDQLLREQERKANDHSPVHSPPMQVSPPVPAFQVENPEWSRLRQRLAWLQRRHAELLVDRTPAHPEVQALDDELVEAQQALSGVPQWIAPATEETSFGPQPATQFAARSPVPVSESETDSALPFSGANGTSLESRLQPEREDRQKAELQLGQPAPRNERAIDSGQAVRQHAEVRRQIDRLAREAERAHARYEELAAAERGAWSDHVREPKMDIVFSPTVEVTPADVELRHLLSTSLLAGIAMMVGVGMFATGAGMERTLGSVDQVSPNLGVPVVATVTLPGLKPAASGRHRGWLRLASCAGGTVLIAGCLGLLYQAIAG
ncbi:MAG: hypothetical protein RBS80_17985 [Thermoguttaceae bacterium]|jgi:hypothetical protein|nr:hypothetical protein [Thermoguttaceae bacterium]